MQLNRVFFYNHRTCDLIPYPFLVQFPYLCWLQTFMAQVMNGQTILRGFLGVRNEDRTTHLFLF